MNSGRRLRLLHSHSPVLNHPFRSPPAPRQRPHPLSLRIRPGRYWSLPHRQFFILPAWRNYPNLLLSIRGDDVLDGASCGFWFAQLGDISGSEWQGSRASGNATFGGADRRSGENVARRQFTIPCMSGDHRPPPVYRALRAEIPESRSAARNPRDACADMISIVPFAPSTNWQLAQARFAPYPKVACQGDISPCPICAGMTR
jgi:hypothetical protein